MRCVDLCSHGPETSAWPSCFRHGKAPRPMERSAREIDPELASFALLLCLTESRTDQSSRRRCARRHPGALQCAKELKFEARAIPIGRGSESSRQTATLSWPSTGTDTVGIKATDHGLIVQNRPIFQSKSRQTILPSEEIRAGQFVVPKSANNTKSSPMHMDFDIWNATNRSNFLPAATRRFCLTSSATCYCSSTQQRGARRIASRGRGLRPQPAEIRCIAKIHNRLSAALQNRYRLKPA
jgi:hypothetical protein